MGVHLANNEGHWEKSPLLAGSLARLPLPLGKVLAAESD